MQILKKDNVTTIEFGEHSRVRGIEFYQWDTGQMLKFPEVQDGVEVQFCSDNTTKTISRLIQNNQVEIPDVLFCDYGTLKVYVLITNKDSSTTIKEVVCYVKEKQRQEDYASEIEKSIFKRDMYNIMSETKSIAQSVRNDADRGEFDGKDYDITEDDYEAIADKVKSDVDSDLTIQINNAKAEVENVGDGKIEAIETKATQELSTIGTAGVDALEHINNAKEQSLNAISTAETEATKAVGNAKTTAQLAIQSNKTTALSNLKEAAEEHLQNIDSEVDVRIAPVQEKIGELEDNIASESARIDKKEDAWVFFKTYVANGTNGGFEYRDNAFPSCKEVFLQGRNLVSASKTNLNIGVRFEGHGSANDHAGTQMNNFFESNEKAFDFDAKITRDGENGVIIDIVGWISGDVTSKSGNTSNADRFFTDGNLTKRFLRRYEVEEVVRGKNIIYVMFGISSSKILNQGEVRVYTKGVF